MKSLNTIHYIVREFVLAGRSTRNSIPFTCLVDVTRIELISTIVSKQLYKQRNIKEMYMTLKSLTLFKNICEIDWGLIKIGHGVITFVPLIVF